MFVLASSTNLKQVTSSACTASRKAARKALTRSKAWTLFFSPPVQRRPGMARLTFWPPTAASQMHNSLVERRIRLLAHTGPCLGPRGRILSRCQTAAKGQRRQRTAPALQQLGRERNGHLELNSRRDDGAAGLRTRRRASKKARWRWPASYSGPSASAVNAR